MDCAVFYKGLHRLCVAVVLDKSHIVICESIASEPTVKSIVTVLIDICSFDDKYKRRFFSDEYLVVCSMRCK